MIEKPQYYLLMFVALGISIAILVSVVGSSLSHLPEINNETCFPIPSFVNVYAWSYYFNTTNHRWYNLTTSSVEIIKYDGYADGISFNQDQVFNGNPAKGDISYVEPLDSNYNGMNITRIDLVLKARASLDNGTLPNDIVRVGIFNSTTGTLIQQFGNDLNPNDFLIRDDSIHLYNFTGSYVVTNGNAITVGMYVVYDNSGFVDNSDTWFNYNSYYYTSTNPDAKGSGFPAPFNDMNYKEFENGVESLDDPTSDFAMKFYASTTTNTYTIIPLTDGHSSPQTIVQTEEGRQACQNTFKLLWVGLGIIPILFLLYAFIIHKKTGTIE